LSKKQIMIIEKKVHANNLVAWAKDKPEVLVLSADLTNSVEVAEFKRAYPERFISCGLTEQNMVGMAGGLAREGFRPWIHTFAVFIYRRTLDQIVSAVSYANLPVALFGFLPGITTPGGMSHQATEDIATLRALPNMTILEPGDATEVENIPDLVYSINGPVYIRMLRGEVPRLFSKDQPMQLGQLRFLSAGSDLTLVTAGISTEEALRAVPALQQYGLSIEHIHLSTHKPLPADELLPSLAKARYGVITMENHTVTGGLGTEIAEVMAANGIGKRLHRIGLQDTYAHGGSRPYLMQYYGLDAMALVKTVENALKIHTGIAQEDLKAVRIEAVHSAAKAEAL
jgi:transketolase